MPFKLVEDVPAYVKSRAGERVTAREIAQWICSAHAAESRRKLQKSEVLHTEADLIRQYVAEVGANRPVMQKRHPGLKVTEGRPRLYYYSTASDEAEVAAPQGAGAARMREDELYPLLSQFLREELAVLSRRIDEKRSSNQRGPNGNRWLYPDVVGLEDLSAGWDEAVRACVEQVGDRRARLWSFEVKLLVNRSNARECFFQAASNSAWAHLGFLVAAELQGRETLKELRMLSAAHGIGLIRLNAEDPGESEILIPARERSQVDWDMANRLATENTDFLGYLKLVKQFYQTGEVHAGDWAAARAAAR